MEDIKLSPTTGFGPVQRPELTVFYVLDTSGSMKGQPIDVLNRAMTSTVNALKKVAARNSNVAVKIAVMEFNTHCRWVQPSGPEYLEHFVWENLSANGLTYVAEPLEELNRKLSRSAWLASSSGHYLPVIVFMTDGHALDDYQPALRRIMQNYWFSKATRIGFAIGKDPDTDMMARITGDSERVIRTKDLGIFEKMLKFVSVSSVTITTNLSGDVEVNKSNEDIRRAYKEAGIEIDIASAY